MGADDDDIVLLHERVLVDRARNGDRVAFGELYRRQAPASWRLGLAVGRDTGTARRAVGEAFAKVLTAGALNRPDRHAPLRAQLLAATRRAAIDVGAEGKEGAPGISLQRSRSGEAQRGTSAEAAAVLDTFHALPERWRSVLWLTAVEDLSPLEAAPVLELSEEATSQLVGRARAGLRERVTRAHALLADDADCRHSLERLDGYSAGTLAPRDSGRVRRHLDRCESCRERLLLVDDVIPVLRLAAPVVPVIVFAEVQQRWRAAAFVTPGPLHFALPGGRSAPAWLERTLAGAVASVVTLGIAAAILAGGRERSRDDILARQASTDEPAPVPDGESALGAGDDLPLVILDQPPAPDLAAPDPRPTSRGEPSPGAARVVGPTPAVLPSDQVSPPPSPTDDPAEPAPTQPAQPEPAPPTSPAPPSAPLAPESAPQLSIAVGDVAEIALGPECTGVEVLDTPLLCDPDQGVAESSTIDLTEDVVEPLLGSLGLGGLGLGG